MEPAAGAGEQVSVEVPARRRNAARTTARTGAVAERASRADRGDHWWPVAVVSRRAENFSVVEALADSLGAAVGASRAQSYYRASWNHGQTGKTVSFSSTLPKISAISTTLAYRRPRPSSRSTDEEAPIFEIADCRWEPVRVAPQLDQHQGPQG